MVNYAEKSRFEADFSRLSEEEKSEILGMAEAFTYTQQLGGSEPSSGTENASKTPDQSGHKGMKQVSCSIKKEQG